MSTNPSESAEQGTPAGDDTAAFRRFYLAETPEKPRSWLYRRLVSRSFRDRWRGRS